MKLTGLPAGNPTRDFVLKTLEHDREKRPSTTELMTLLKSLEEGERKTRKATHGVDVTYWKHLINSDEDWDFAQVWEINTTLLSSASISLTSSDNVRSYSKTCFTDAIVNKFSVTKNPSSPNVMVK